MLGVLKRRWKPKRASNGGRLSVDSCPADAILEKVVVRPGVHHQVHPVCEDKAHVLAYERDKIPPGPLEVAPLPPAPNICVEGGRIEFIKASPGGGGGTGVTLAPVAPPMVTRAQQCDEEKFDVAKESLEARIAELEEALEAAKRTELRDKQTLTKLQKQLSRRESAQRDVERERRLRAESESRVREAAAEAARCRNRLKLLTQEFSRMEETVRAMLVYKGRAEQLKQEKAALTVAFETRSQQYQSTISRLNQEVSSLRQQLDTACGPAEGRVAALEAENAALARDAEATRRQYERCLDDVANQVVRALLAQKNLREEIGSLTRRIRDLESQNRALTTLLVHQLKGDDSGTEAARQLALEGLPERPASLPDSPETEPDRSPAPDTGSTLKHCNSFNSEVLSESSEPRSSLVSRINGKHLSADADLLEAGLSFEDKKRHQVLAKLWTELKGAEVTPQKLLEALSAVDSALWVPPKRPVSLNLQLPIFQARQTRPVLAQSSSKSEEETGNESPESGNRDEGYSTMSSDVQVEVARVSGEPARGLEDLKEATDETELGDARIIVVEDQGDPDILYIPLNLAFGLNPRNSFPPSKSMLPFQHIMRSFSDSHLCLKITTAPSPCYSLASPMSSSPSILFLDITDAGNPLRRAKATALFEYPDEEVRSRISWCGQEDGGDVSAWDTDYVQQWLRLDETRSAFQQHQRDLLELEYDRAELEDWSLSLSNEELRESWRKPTEIMTPGQISVSTLPSIQENNPLELEEDSNEYLWNNSSYMMDKTGGELVALLMDAPVHSHQEKRWPYGQTTVSPGDSWSSAETNSEDCFHHEQEVCSKRSSAALSGCSDDTNESHPIGTDFTRDFYRLVKFESTKSLASISSRSAAGCLSDCDREQALQNVLTFIAEQQFYCSAREECDSRPSSMIHDDQIKDFNVEGPPQNIEEIATQNESDLATLNNEMPSGKFIENYVNFKQLKAELALNEQNSNNSKCAEATQCIINTMCDSVQNRNINDSDVSNMTIVTTNDNSSEMSEVSEVSLVNEVVVENGTSDTNDAKLEREHLSPCSVMTESQTSSVSTPDTIVSRIPRRQFSRSTTPCKSSPKASPTHSQKIPQPIPHKSPMKSRIPAKHNIKQLKSPKIPKLKIATPEPATSQPVITSERLPPCSSGLVGSSVIDGPPHRAVSFHERATSKDVIDELNRMIRKEGETVQEADIEKNARLDEACKSTGWIHVEKTVDLNDPKARESILDVMLASSDSSPTSSCGGSVSSESTDDPPDYGHLHRIHRYNRQRKACAVRPQHAVLRYVSHVRPCIIGRDDFFVRYGEKEREAVASFDFLDEFSTGSLTSSIEEEAEAGVVVGDSRTDINTPS